MAASAVARALTLIFAIGQSYFKWSPYEIFQSSNEILPFQHGQHLAGLILARGGSKGLPRKNMSNLHGKPLIGWTLSTMVESGVFTSMWVSTDDPETAEYVKKAFPTVRIHNRAEYTATDEASSLIAVQEFLEHHPEIDAIGLLQATSPFTSVGDVKKGAYRLRKFDSVFSATRSHELRWKATFDPEKEPTVSLNFDPKDRQRRQDRIHEMVENGQFYYSMRDVIVNENRFQGKRCTYVETPKYTSLEIDTLEDSEMAKWLMTTSH